MWLNEVQVKTGQSFRVPQSPSQRLPQVQLVLSGGDVGVSIEPNGLMLLISLSGRIGIEAGGGRVSIARHEFHVCDPTLAHHVHTPGNGLLLILSLSTAAMRQLDVHSTQQLLPGSGRIDAATMILLHGALRGVNAMTSEFWRREATVRALLRSVIRAQSDLNLRLTACPGKSRWRKTQVMVRLQRARNFLERNVDRPIRISELAEMSNFSHWYFTKTFHRVYGEAPKDFVTRVRLERARTMIRSSAMAIGEVAAACGFESHSAFSRAFRNRYGNSAMTERSRSSAH